MYTKIAPTSIASGTPHEFTESTTSRLTYTGTSARHIKFDCNVSIDHTGGATRTLNFAIYKNGSVIASSEIMVAMTTTTAYNIPIQADTTCVTNDYFEIYAKITGAGNIQTYTLNMFALAIV